MPPIAASVLVVSSGNALGMGPMLMGLASQGCGSRSAYTLRQAQELLQRFRFDVVLAAETLPDGRAYELVDTVARNSGTLLVGIALSESYLWLPVLERGVNVFGKRALKAGAIELEVQTLLRGPAAENVREIAATSQLGRMRPGLYHVVSSRQKGASVLNKTVPPASSTRSAESRPQEFARTGK